MDLFASLRTWFVLVYAPMTRTFTVGVEPRIAMRDPRPVRPSSRTARG